MNIGKSVILRMSIIITIFVLCITTFNSYRVNAVENTVTGTTYVVYDAQTGLYLRNYVLSDVTLAPNSYNQGNVRASGDWYCEWSNPGVLNIKTLENDIPYSSTGFVVDEHTIATGAHCVLGKTIFKIYAFNNNSSFSYLTAVEMHIPQPYVNGNNNYDYALITVEEDLSDRMQFNIGVALDEASENEIAVKSTGFPSVVNNQTVNSSNYHRMYTGEGELLVNNYNPDNYDLSRRLFHSIPHDNGSSGSPIYYTETFNGNTYYTVIGIDTAHNSAGQLGIATKITPEILKFYLSNTNLVY